MTILFMIFVLSSCVEDDADPIPGNILPTSSLLSSTITSSSLSGLSTTLNVTSGDSPLDLMTILKNGSSDFLDDISVDGFSVDDHFIVLSGSDKTSFSHEVEAHLRAGEAAVFTFDIVAENNDETSQTLTFNITPDLRLPSGEKELKCQASSIKELKFTGLLGTSLLQSFAVNENGLALDISRLTFGGLAVSANPILLGSDQIEGFTETIAFQIHASSDTLKTYAFVLTDQNGEEDAISIKINTKR